MYAIVETDGRQYKVSSGEKINVERIGAEADTGVTLDKVLVISTDDKNVIGMPYVKGAEVKAEVVGNGKSKKVIVHKQRPRRVYRKTNGHRQQYTTLKIKEIVFGG